MHSIQFCGITFVGSDQLLGIFSVKELVERIRRIPGAPEATFPAAHTRFTVNKMEQESGCRGNEVAGMGVGITTDDSASPATALGRFGC
jgi:hypothetical protein